MSDVNFGITWITRQLLLLSPHFCASPQGLPLQALLSAFQKVRKPGEDLARGGSAQADASPMNTSFLRGIPARTGKVCAQQSTAHPLICFPWGSPTLQRSLRARLSSAESLIHQKSLRGWRAGLCLGRMWQIGYLVAARQASTDTEACGD